MSAWAFPVLLESLKITGLVFVMMVAMDYLNVLSKGKLTGTIWAGAGRQYLLASLLGATPGCLGAFGNVTLYVHGALTFGAMVGGMIATSGDEAFVMLSLFPRTAMLLFLLLFAAGIVFGWITDRIAPLINIRSCEGCKLDGYHPEEASAGHYLRHHIWEHIIKKHLWCIFLWTFGTLLLLNVALRYWDTEGFVTRHTVWVLLLSGLVGIIPESGPHLMFVMMFSKGLIPFSVLFTSSFVQDGHGLLPLLSYTIRDTVLIKLFNCVFGITVGMILYMLGT